MGKSCVATFKITTIPRLELTAEVVSAKVGVMLQELNYTNLKQFFWTDSKIVTGYINNDAKRFHTFVANRVHIIRSNTDTKKRQHIDIHTHPADHASRGLSAEEQMRSNWFSGPAFLWQKEMPTSKEEIPNIQIGDPEVKATVRTTVVKESFNVIDYMSRFCNWTRAVGVISYLRRRPTEGQKMVDLPEDRVESTPPFTYCGMDCFGPFTVKERSKELKRYAVIFTCMSSRAVHIEQLDDMTTDAFINTFLSRFVTLGIYIYIYTHKKKKF